MKRRILWLDNDPSHLKPFIRVLSEEGWTVIATSSVSEAEDSLYSTPPDLLLLDVMIPTKTPKEEESYPPSETDQGYKTGLVFYKRHQELMKKHGVKVLVMTVRLDEDIFREFLEVGLPEKNFATKFKLRDKTNFKATIQEILSRTED